MNIQVREGVCDVTRPRTIKGYKEHVSMPPYNLHLYSYPSELKTASFSSPSSASQRLVEMLVKSTCALHSGGDTPWGESPHGSHPQTHQTHFFLNGHQPLSLVIPFGSPAEDDCKGRSIISTSVQPRYGSHLEKLILFLFSGNPSLGQSTYFLHFSPPTPLPARGPRSHKIHLFWEMLPSGARA